MYVLCTAKRTVKWRTSRKMHWKSIKSLHLARSSVLHESMQSSVVVAQAAAHRLIARKPLREAAMKSGRLSIAIAGSNDEVGRTDESTKQVHMTAGGHLGTKASALMLMCVPCLLRVETQSHLGRPIRWTCIDGRVHRSDAAPQ